MQNCDPDSMAPIISIALLRPDDASADTILPLFQRHEYYLRLLRDVAELCSVLREEGEHFDMVVIPFRMSTGLTALNCSLSLRMEPELAALPQCVLCPSKDRALLSSLYGAGADAVVPAPFDSELLFFQLTALLRQRRHYEELVLNQAQSVEVRQITQTALDLVREGVLILDPDGLPIFANQAAITVIGLSAEPTRKEFEQLRPQFSPFIKVHAFERSALNEKASDKFGERPQVEPALFSGAQASSVARRELSLTRLNGQSFIAAVRVSPLRNTQGAHIGWVVVFSDLSEVEQLGAALLQARRLQTLALITSAASLRWLSATIGVMPVAPIATLEKELSKEPLRCKLGEILTSLLEILDLTLGAAISIKVTGATDSSLALRPSDALQLIGYILLQAAEVSGARGTITVTCKSASPQEVLLHVSAEGTVPPSLLENDTLSALLKGDYSRSIQAERAAFGDSEPNKLGYGLSAAQQIADRYRCLVEFQQSTPSKIKLRVKLPLAIAI
jgi:PAS domain-containing protein